MRRLDKSHDNVIGYSLQGDVSNDEYEQTASQLRDDIATHGAVRLLFRLTDLSVSSFFSAIDEQFRFLKDHSDDIERIAIVTDETAAGVIGKIGESLQSVDVRTFSTDEEPKAWAWLE